MNKVIFDTNFYSDLSNGYPEVVAAFEHNAFNEHEIIMPTIIEHELLSYSHYDQDTATKEQIDDFLQLPTKIIPLDSKIAKKASEIRRHYRIIYNKRLKAPDAIIAATAILENAILYSNNDEDFNNATELGLNYQNPITDQQDLQKYRNQRKMSE